MDIEELKQIIRLLKEEGLNEITLWDGERRITVRQGVTTPSEVAEVSQAGGAPVQEEGTFAVTAPLVGTFYRRSSPEEEPFIVEGAQVEPGDTLCVIEAMKVLNEIKAGERGRLRRILVNDGDAVEYGQPLFLFEHV